MKITFSHHILFIFIFLESMWEKCVIFTFTFIYFKKCNEYLVCHAEYFNYLMRWSESVWVEWKNNFSFFCKRKFSCDSGIVIQEGFYFCHVKYQLFSCPYRFIFDLTLSQLMVLMKRKSKISLLYHSNLSYLKILQWI